MKKHILTTEQRFVKHFLDKIPAGYTSAVYRLESLRSKKQRPISKASLWAMVNVQNFIPLYAALRLHKAFPHDLLLSKILDTSLKD